MTRFEYWATCPHCGTRVQARCALVQGKTSSFVLRCNNGHDFIVDVRAVPIVDIRKCQQREAR